MATKLLASMIFAISALLHITCCNFKDIPHTITTKTSELRNVTRDDYERQFIKEYLSIREVVPTRKDNIKDNL
jgi:hypothetical protein